MRFLILLTLVTTLVSARFSNGGRPRPDGPTPSHIFGNYFGSANRNNGSVSLVNPDTFEEVIVPIPDDGEPMYFVCLFRAFPGRPVEFWVGDRANNRLAILLLIRDEVVFDDFLTTPKGLFHSMSTQRLGSRRPLAFTTCDIDRVTVVHDVKTRKFLCTMEMPSQVKELGAVPHDVTSDDRYAFVTYLGGSDGFGYVASYIARTCQLITYIRTAQDPHVAVRPGSRLYIAAQGGEVLSRTVPFMKPLTNDTDQPSPHGMFMSFNKRHLYITNIAGGGTDAVVVYDQKKGILRDCPQINTTFPVPHNPTASYDNKRLYITHSIGDDNVNSQWDIGRDGCLVPGSEKIIRTGNNPFGTAIVPPPSFQRLKELVRSSKR